VWVASPRPARATLAAAAIAEADALLAAGGAQAIAALAFGAGPVPKCDAVVGPGNRYVTAAKRLVAGTVLIDSLAGPSELVVLADASAGAERIAADLVAQAEHDPDARVALVTTDGALADAVAAEAGRQLASLPTADAARASLARGRSFVLASLEEAIAACNRLAPEHLAVWLEDPDDVAPRLAHYGALFLGSETSVAFGDYGAGPNHVLPTAGTARSMGGLSVLTFLRVRTWLRMHASPVTAAFARDTAKLARMEGLEAHARAAELRANDATER
jgi:phosphoribosyl-ATP pyrophosphohydrolase/phosphoribosyl-AMP cyclohydrolase/histidinol dehydrogenase